MLIMMFLMMAQFAILQVPRALACLTRAAEVLGVEPEIADDPAPRALAPAEKDAEVARFDHVSMRFSDADEDTLHDLTFLAAPRRGHGDHRQHGLGQVHDRAHAAALQRRHGAAA